jgi:exportin-5
VDPQIREARVDQFYQPLIDQWQNPALGHSLSSFQSFTKLLGLDGLQQYLSTRAVQRIPDWSSHPLDDEGKTLQARMEVALDVSMPTSRQKVSPS